MIVARVRTGRKEIASRNGAFSASGSQQVRSRRTSEVQGRSGCVGPDSSLAQGERDRRRIGLAAQPFYLAQQLSLGSEIMRQLDS